ncbi:hypothetical protein TNCV_2911641, partial [Trichonephila clavipes]
TTSGCFYPRSNPLGEVGGRPQCDKCGCRVRIAHSIVSRLWRQFQTTGTAIRGSVVVVHEESTPAVCDRHIKSSTVQEIRNSKRQAQSSGEIRHVHGFTDTGDFADFIRYRVFTAAAEDTAQVVSCFRTDASRTVRYLL